MQKRRFSLFGLLLLLGSLALCLPGRAMDMYSYDLDSLVYLSSDVIDADIVSVASKGGLDLTDVKVTRVYQGHFTIGQTVQVTALDFFWVGERNDDPKDLFGKGRRLFGKGRRLGAGDHVTLFLAKARPVFLYNIPKDADIYWPAPSGVKLIDQGRVKGFEQYNNPGPYETEWADEKALKTLPNPEQFRRELAESIREAARLKPLLQGKAVQTDEPKLLAVLRKRVRTGHHFWFRERDAISEAACTQIVSLRDFEAVADALAIDVADDESLVRAVTNAAGRNFLIKVVQSPVQPLARRLGCARALYGAYDRAGIKKDGDYVSRLVTLACRVRDSSAVQSGVLSSLDGIARLNVSSKNGQNYPAKPKIKAGLPLLREAYAAAHSEPVRFAFEKLILDGAGLEAYRSLNSSCGPVVSLLQPSDLPPVNDQLTYSSTIRYAAAKRDDLAVSLVLVNVTTGDRRILPRGQEVDGWEGGEEEQMTMQAPLPPSLSHGRYRAFLEFNQAGKPVSAGHFFEAEL